MTHGFRHRVSTPATLARVYPRCVRVVHSFEELVRTPLANGVNALCWERRIEGDFRQIAAHFSSPEGVVGLERDELESTAWSPDAKQAARAIVEDYDRLTALGQQPEINRVTEYVRDTRSVSIATDVYSFHVDRSPVPLDTWLCTYYGAPTQGLSPEAATLRVAEPAVRAELLRRFGGPDDQDFAAYLEEHNYDLHYRPTPGAVPWSFGVGHLWRLSTAWPGNPALPCIHRAPLDTAGAARLLLIS